MSKLGDKLMREAFAAIGQKLRLDRNVQILIVGSAAGVLTGQLPPAWTTGDVDLLFCHLPSDQEDVLAAAEAVGQRNGTACLVDK